MKQKHHAALRVRPVIRCAIYCRKSTEEGLDQEFNSLDAQRASAEAYIRSQADEGWICLPEHYDDGGYSGGNLDRPALQRLLADIAAGRVDLVLCYKVDRLSRSLLDFARLMEIFEKHRVSFVAVTQLFNTATSMGRLMLNVLLSFAQFERELIAERTRDKIAATRRQGKWCGGLPLLGYDIGAGPRLVVNEAEARRVRGIFALYLRHEGLLPVLRVLEQRGWRTKQWVTRKGRVRGGRPFSKSGLRQMLANPTYLGKLRYRSELYDGAQPALVDPEVWQQAQALLAANRLALPARRPGDAVLKGLLRCRTCACAMTPSHTRKNDKIYRYYVCCNAVNRGWQECPSRSVAAAEIERYVVEQLRGMALSACQSGSANGAIDLDRLWQAGSLTMQARAVRCLIERAEYDGDAGAVAITVRPDGWQQIHQLWREQSCRKRKRR